MTTAGLPILGYLKQRMKWHQARQGVLAENVANADTPGYQARDLKALKFNETLAARQPVKGLMRTNAAHIAGATGGADGFKSARTPDWETTPEGNGVVLEEQMMKVAENQMDYQTAAALYTRSIGLLKLALGK